MLRSRRGRVQGPANASPSKSGALAPKAGTKTPAKVTPRKKAAVRALGSKKAGKAGASEKATRGQHITHYNIARFTFFLFQNGAKNRDLRCGLHPTPSGAGARYFCLESRTRKLKLHFIYACFSGPGMDGKQSKRRGRPRKALCYALCYALVHIVLGFVGPCAPRSHGAMKGSRVFKRL